MGVSELVEGDVFDAPDMVFRFEAGLIDRETGYLPSASLARVHILYTELLNNLKKDWNEKKP